MIYIIKPPFFSPKFAVVGCFIEYRETILLLHRLDHKPQGDTWGIPAGKVEPGEQILETMVREIREETGINPPPTKIKHFADVYVKYSQFDFVHHIFYTRLNNPAEVSINPAEHKDFRWTTPTQALKIPLIPDLDACIKLFYKI